MNAKVSQSSFDHHTETAASPSPDDVRKETRTQPVTDTSSLNGHHPDVRGLIVWEKLRVGCSTAATMAEPVEPENLKRSRCETAHTQAEPVEHETSRGLGANYSALWRTFVEPET